MLHIKNVNGTVLFKVQNKPVLPTNDEFTNECLVPRISNKKKRITLDQDTLDDIVACLASLASKFTSSRYNLKWNTDTLNHDLREWVLKACS
jgi:hypothetical protein